MDWHSRGDSGDGGRGIVTAIGVLADKERPFTGRDGPDADLLEKSDLLEGKGSIGILDEEGGDIYGFSGLWRPRGPGIVVEGASVLKSTAGGCGYRMIGLCMSQEGGRRNDPVLEEEAPSVKDCTDLTLPTSDRSSSESISLLLDDEV